jgi:hypothetical protein
VTRKEKKIMTKAELRNARKAAHAVGLALTGELAINKTNANSAPLKSALAPVKKRARYASKAEQHARYIDCGYNNWDDR